MKMVLLRQDSSTKTPEQSQTRDHEDYIRVRSQATDRAIERMMAIVGCIAENIGFAK
jgi:hypothetical protein